MPGSHIAPQVLAAMSSGPLDTWNESIGFSSIFIHSLSTFKRGSYLNSIEPCIVAHVCNSSIVETEAAGLP